MSDSEIKIIGTIDFHEMKINVYFHPDNESNPNIINVAWQMRNPDSCYTGILFMNNETGKITYPKDAVIPVQTDEDREIIPKSIIVGLDELNDETVKSIELMLESSYLKRNHKNF